MVLSAFFSLGSMGGARKRQQIDYYYLLAVVVLFSLFLFFVCPRIPLAANKPYAGIFFLFFRVVFVRKTAVSHHSHTFFVLLLHSVILFVVVVIFVMFFPCNNNEQQQQQHCSSSHLLRVILSVQQDLRYIYVSVPLYEHVPDYDGVPLAIAAFRFLSDLASHSSEQLQAVD